MAVVKISKHVSQWLDVPSMDPDDARRRKLLNILLFGLATVSLLALLATAIADIIGFQWESKERSITYLAAAGLLGTSSLVFVINRYVSGWLASLLLLLVLTVAVAFADKPQEVAGGRSLLMFAIPIMMGSVLLRSYASFIIAGLSSLVVAVVAFSLKWVPNPFAMLAFFVLALVSWLASSTLERALRDLRVLNRELEERVRQRTRDLAESLNKIEAILDSTADGIIVFDPEDRAVVANPAIASLLGRPAHCIIGLTLDGLMGEEVDPADRERIAQLLNDRENAHSGIRLRWGKKTFATSLAPVHDNSGRVTGTVAVFRDYTREAEIDRMKSTFVSIASHELRTPLSAIIGYAEMLQAGIYGKLTDQQRSVVGRVVANTNQLLSLANNLLDRAQLEAGRLTLHIGTFSPTELVTSVRGVMDVMAQGKGLRLTSHIATDVPATLTGDHQRLYQILTNLVSNAIKFTEEGSVDVGVYMHDADHWALTVTDTGPGIAPEAREYIFEAFRQADESITREYSGAGLGLSIAKQLVSLMGGEIRLESEIGKGSTFTVILPLVPPATEGKGEQGDEEEEIANCRK